MDASGTIGEAIVFSKWKGRNYVRERVIPSNPKSGAQTGRRSLFSFLTQNWALEAAGTQATWQDLADQLIASPFNAFVSENMKNWHNFLAPSVAYPAARVLDGSDNALDAAAWEENRIKLTVSGSAFNDVWGIAIFAQLDAAVAPTVGNCIMVERETTFAEHYIYWTPPSVGTWHFDSRTFSTDGKLSGDGGPANAAP